MSINEIELWIAALFSKWIVNAVWRPPETIRSKDRSLIYKTSIALNPTIFLPSLTDYHFLITAKISQKCLNQLITLWISRTSHAIHFSSHWHRPVKRLAIKHRFILSRNPSWFKVWHEVNEHIINDLIHYTRDFESFFGRKINTRENWKTDFKPNILEGKSKRFVLRKKRDQKKKKERKNTRWKKKKKWNAKHMSHFNDFRRERIVTPLD